MESNKNNQKENGSAFPGYPHYPPSEDIYRRGIEETEIDPDDITKVKTNDVPKNISEDSNDNILGNDLDVPGSELDDQLESVGSEDEENNFYSIGGDNHNDLEEDDADNA